MPNIMSAKDLPSGRQTTMLAISLLMAVAFIFASCSLDGSDAAVGDEFSSEGVDYKITSEDPLEVAAVGYDAGASEIRIPCTVTYDGHDYMITSIGAGAFKDCAADIGFKSFAKCTSLETIVLSGSSVGSYGFYGCSSLSQAAFNGTGTTVGTSAFSGCSSLTDADLKNVKAIGKHAFYKCALTSADLSAATDIGYGAFTGNDLQSVKFSESLSAVDAKAFFGYRFLNASDARMSIEATALAGQSFEGQGIILKAVV